MKVIHLILPNEDGERIIAITIENQEQFLESRLCLAAFVIDGNSDILPMLRIAAGIRDNNREINRLNLLESQRDQLRIIRIYENGV